MSILALVGAKGDFAQVEEAEGELQLPLHTASDILFSLYQPPAPPRVSFHRFILGRGLFFLGFPEQGLSRLLHSYLLVRRDQHLGKSQDHGCAILFLQTIGITIFPILSQQEA